MPAGIRKRIRGKTGDIRITEIARFDSSFDSLWEKASVSFGIIIRRDSAYLNWRFVDQPCREYKIFKAFRKENGDPEGYIVLREGRSRGLKSGIITDIFASGSDPDILISLIDFAISFFAKRDDVALIRCDMLSRDVGKALKAHGFVKIHSSDRFMFTKVGNGIDADYIADPGNWFLDYSDSDLDL